MPTYSASKIWVLEDQTPVLTCARHALHCLSYHTILALQVEVCCDSLSWLIVTIPLTRNRSRGGPCSPPRDLLGDRLHPSPKCVTEILLPIHPSPLASIPMTHLFMRPCPFGTIFDTDVQPQLGPRGSMLAVHT